MAHEGGRPRKWKTPEEMQIAIDAYFEEIKATGKPPTVMGLVRACDFADRQSLINYCGYSDKFLDTIKKAKGKVEEYLEERLSQGQNVAGLIFNLKNNFSWVDKQEIDNTIHGELSLGELLSKRGDDKK